MNRSISFLNVLLSLLLVVTPTCRSAEAAEAFREDCMKETEIRMTFGKTEIFAVLDGSETSRAFLELLPLTIEMRNYADREYYAALGELPEDGEAIPDFENGDITYYTAGKSLAIFFGNAGKSHQGDLIRMGKITSDLNLFAGIPDSVTVIIEKADKAVSPEDFSALTNITITGTDLSDLKQDELAVLYCWAEYNQAMTDADIDTLRRLVPEDMTFRHMSGMTQTREEYFADIADGSLDYITTELKNPVITVNGDHAAITCTTVLTARAYGARGSWPFTGTRSFEKHDGVWKLSSH